MRKLPKDIAKLIALELADWQTWINFSQACSTTRRGCKELLQKKNKTFGNRFSKPDTHTFIWTELNGKRHGPVIELDADDNIRFVTVYFHGSQNGVQRRWTETGNLVWEIHYRRGVYHGVEQVWFYDGTLKSHHIWDSGQCVASWHKTADIKR